jgi:hypothetical protein
MTSGDIMRHTLKEVFDHNSDGLRASVRHSLARLIGALHHKPAVEDAGPAMSAGLAPDEGGPGLMGLTCPPGTEPGTLQFRAPEDSPYFGTQNAEAAPTGNTYQERTGAATQWLHPDLEAPRAGPPDAGEDTAGASGDEPNRKPS